MKKYKILAIVFLIAILVGALAVYIKNHDLAVLAPKGHIAAREKSLMVFATLLSLILIIPVFLATFLIVFRYRAHKKSKYSPDLHGNRLVEVIWWGIPIILILVLSVVTWRSSHELDPFRPIKAQEKTMKIQVVALDWKWLFIYPEQKIASINYVQFPEDTPIDFEITADAPMNSFWIPQLGGQMYAMSGMSTHLHLIADDPGTYRGSSANISGEGFAGMTFAAKSVSKDEFSRWADKTSKTSRPFNMDSYDQLAQPSKNNPVEYFRLAQDDLYNQIVAKYMPYHEHGDQE